MAVWDDLKPALRNLAAAHALTSYPDPRSDEDRHPPFSMQLASWALRQAVALHEQFGDDVELQVGAMRYPDPQPCVVRESFGLIPEIDASEALVRLGAPIEVHSGHSLRARLHFSGRGNVTLGIPTNGELTATIVDPVSARPLGGHSGAVRAPLVIFDVSPGDEVDIPLHVATDSFVPELGYAIPAGAWHLAAILRVIDHPDVRTPFFH